MAQYSRRSSRSAVEKIRFRPRGVEIRDRRISPTQECHRSRLQSPLLNRNQRTSPHSFVIRSTKFIPPVSNVRSNIPSSTKPGPSAGWPPFLAASRRARESTPLGRRRRALGRGRPSLYRFRGGHRRGQYRPQPPPGEGGGSGSVGSIQAIRVFRSPLTRTMLSWRKG